MAAQGQMTPIPEGHTTRWQVEQDEHGLWHVQRYTFGAGYACYLERAEHWGPYSMKEAHNRARVLNTP